MMLGWVSIEKDAATPACAAWVSALCRATVMMRYWKNSPTTPNKPATA